MLRSSVRGRPQTPETGCVSYEKTVRPPWAGIGGKHSRGVGSFRSQRCVLYVQPLLWPKSRGALGEGSEPMAPRRRQLRRNVSREALPVEVASVKCIRGGRRKRWMVLETITHMGHECVCVSGRHPWLHMLLAGQVHRSPFHAAINNFVRDCRAAARRQWRGNSSEALSEPAGTPASSQGGPKGRAAIFGSDSDSDHARMESPAKRRRVGGKPVARTGLRSVLIRGITVRCFCGPGPRLLVPVDTDDLDRIVQHLVTRAGEQADSDSSFGHLLSESDAGLILWKAPAASSQGAPVTAGSWQIIYQNDKGQTKRTREGLQVPAIDLAGEALSAEAVRDVASKVLVKARRLWNQSDYSERPRLLDNIPG